ncbi:hypothetical protein M513_12384, partial [Trichuris suis]
MLDFQFESLCETVSVVPLPYKVDFLECFQAGDRNTPVIGCSMYELFEPRSEKRGGVCILGYESDTETLFCHAEWYGDALYKLTWLDSRSILAVSSCGDLCAFRWCEDSLVRSFATNLANTSLTSVSVSKQPHLVGSTVLIGDALGNLHFGRIGTETFQSDFSWCGHWLTYGTSTKCETMCTEMDLNNAFIVYSGGDDCQWKSWDLRLPVKKPLHVNKFHSAGVTCLFDNASRVLFCGSYDDSLSAWDKRSLTKPVDHIHVGGAAWTIRSDKEGASKRIVCACIRQGIVEIVTTESGKMTLRCMDSVLGSQMVYAADWFRSKENSIVASSYSDRRVHLLKLPQRLNKYSGSFVPTACPSENGTCHGE